MATGELARVLMGSGVFLYDTINRTTFSRFTMIKMAQEWKFTRLAPPRLHVGEMFILKEGTNISSSYMGYAMNP